jgi:hypothetical protein
VYPDGEVSQALDRLQPGDKLALKGPFGKFVYRPGKYKTIGAAPCGERAPRCGAAVCSRPLGSLAVRAASEPAAVHGKLQSDAGS